MKLPAGHFVFQDSEYEYPAISSLEKGAELFRKSLAAPEHGCWCLDGVREECSGSCETCLLCSNAGESRKKTEAFRHFCGEHGVMLPPDPLPDSAAIPAGEFRYGDLIWRHPAVLDPAVLAEEYGKAMSSGKMDAAWCRNQSRGDCSGISCDECLFCASNGSFLRKKDAFEAFCGKHGIALPVLKRTTLICRANLRRGDRDFFMPPIRDTERMVQDFLQEIAVSPFTACWCHNCLEEECLGGNCRGCLLCSNFGDPRTKVKNFLLYCRMNEIPVPEISLDWKWKIPSGKFDFEGTTFFYPDISDPELLMTDFASRMTEEPQKARWCGVNITSCRNTFDCRDCLLDHSEGPVPLKLRAFEAFCREKNLKLPVLSHRDPSDWVEGGTFQFEGENFSWPYIPSLSEMMSAFESECRKPDQGMWCPKENLCSGNCESCICAFTSEDPDRKLRAFRAFAADHGENPDNIPDPNPEKRILRGFFQFDGDDYIVPYLTDGFRTAERFSEGIREGKLAFCWCGKEGAETCGNTPCAECIFCSNCGWAFRKLLAFQAFCQEKQIPLSCHWTPPEPEVPGGTLRKGKETYFWPDLLCRSPLPVKNGGNPCTFMVLKCNQKCAACLLSEDPGEPEMKKELRKQFEAENDVSLCGPKQEPQEEDMWASIEPEPVPENGFPGGKILWKGKTYCYPVVCDRDKLIREFRKSIRNNLFEAVWCGNGVKKDCGGLQCADCLLCSSPEPFLKIEAFREVLKKENIPVPDLDLLPVPDIRKGSFLFEGYLFEVPEIVSIRSLFRSMRQNFFDRSYASFCLPYERERCSRNCGTCLLCTNIGPGEIKFRAWKQFLAEKNIPFPEDCTVSFSLEIPPGTFSFEGRVLHHPGVASRQRLAEAFQEAEGDRLPHFNWCGNGGAGNCFQPERLKCEECLFSSDHDEHPFQRIRAFFAFCRENQIPILSDQNYPDPIQPPMTFQLREDGTEWQIPPILNLQRIEARFKASIQDRSCFHAWWCSPSDAECCAGQGSGACETCLLNSVSGHPGEKMLGMAALFRKNGIKADPFPENFTEIPGGTMTQGKNVWHFPPIIRKKALVEAFRNAMKECPLSACWCLPGVAFLCPEEGCESCLLCTNAGDGAAKLKAFQEFCKHEKIDLSGIPVEKNPEIPGGIFRSQGKKWHYPDIYCTERMISSFEEVLQEDPQTGKWCMSGIRGPCDQQCEHCLLCSDERYPGRKFRAFLSFCRKHKIQGDPLTPEPEDVWDYEEITDEQGTVKFRIPPVFRISAMVEDFVREIAHPYSACWCRNAIRSCCEVECRECLLCSNRGDPAEKYEAFLSFCRKKNIVLPETHPDFSMELSPRNFSYHGKEYHFPGVTRTGAMQEAFRVTAERSPWRAVWCTGIAGPCEGKDCADCLLCSNCGDAREKIGAFEAFCRQNQLSLPPVKIDYSPKIPSGIFSGEGMTCFYPAVRDPEGLAEEFAVQIRSLPAVNRMWCGRHTEPCGEKSCDECLFSTFGKNPEKKVALFQVFCREHQLDIPDCTPDFSSGLPAGIFMHKGKKWHYPELSSAQSALKKMLDHWDGEEEMPECLCAGAVSCEKGPHCKGCLFHGKKKLDAKQMEAILAFVHEKEPENPDEIEKF